MSKVAFQTLGCKVNSYESEGMLELFKKKGYESVDFKEKSDIYVINTCTVTNTGDAKSRQMIRRARKRNPNSIIAVVGCYAQIASAAVADIDGVDIVIGTQNKNKIVEYVEDYLKNKQQIIDVHDVMKLKSFEDLNIASFENRTRAFMKIQDGCNNFCTFCIIPYARGAIRSRDKEDVIRQAQELVDKGFVEIVLTGIHTAGYGIDLEDYSFYDLLEDLTNKVKGLKRLRISSIEMSQVTPDIINLMAHSSIIVDHLHIPIQSGNDKILKKMARHYTTSEFEEKLNKLKEALPNLSVTTDVIVGFPGETEEDFESTYQWIKKNHFNQLHVFPYSARTGTPAARMPYQIPGDIKKKRVKRLLQLSDSLKAEFASWQIGKYLDVLFEEEKDGYKIGHASNYLKVKVRDQDIILNQIYSIHIKEQNGVDLIGERNEKNQ